MLAAVAIVEDPVGRGIKDDTARPDVPTLRTEVRDGQGVLGITRMVEAHGFAGRNGSGRE
jgi:hypothetical protein